MRLHRLCGLALLALAAALPVRAVGAGGGSAPGTPRDRAEPGADSIAAVVVHPIVRPHFVLRAMSRMRRAE